MITEKQAVNLVALKGKSKAIKKAAKKAGIKVIDLSLWKPTLSDFNME